MDFNKLLKIFIIFLVVFGWVFSGWPQIWPLDELGVNKIRIPPRVQVAQAQVVEYNTAGSGQFTAQVTGLHYIILVGGGGGGGGGGTGTNKRGGGGGGGGANLQKTISLTKGTSYNYTVGAAGTGGASNANGTAGATTTFAVGATTYTAGNGRGGAYGIAGAAAGGAGGTAINGDTNRTGGTGGNGSDSSGSGGGASAAGTGANGNNGGTPPASVAGGAYVANYGGAGGDGSTANSAAGSAASTAADNYGGGGGGGTRNGSGGDGRVGYIRIVYNAPPTFTVGPDDAPDPVNQGNDVTFSGTATDGENNSWYLAVCKTDSVTAGTPPTCDTDQTYCVSSSAVGSGSQNTCMWTSTGEGEQTYYAFACDNDATYGPQCSLSSSSTVTVTVVSAEVSCSVSATSTKFSLLTADAVSTSTPNINVLMSCTSTASGCKLSVQGTGSGEDPGLWNSIESHLIPSADTTLSAGTEGYGIQATSTDMGWTLDPKYVVTGNQVGGLAPPSLQYTLASSATDIATSTLTVTHKAARSAGTPTGSYQDTITYSCLPN